MRTLTVLLISTALVLAAQSAAAKGSSLTPTGDLRIPKVEVTGTAVFYPFKAGKVYLEVLAVRAPDGTIRIALNTCQVCYSSGRGYYTQKGDVLVCNNCGNRFPLARVGLVKGGCNPVPVAAEARTEDAQFIVISKAFLTEAAPLFANWKKK